MVRRIPRKGWDEKIILSALFLQIFMMEWLGVSRRFSFIITGIILLYVFKCIFTKKLKPGIWAVLFAYLLYFTIQPLLDGFKFDVFYINIKSLSGTIPVICFFYFVGNRLSILESFLKKIFYIINAYIVINIPVIIAQINGHLELSGRHTEENPFECDLICGLFGYNGTPMLGIFLCFFFIYDHWYYKKYMKRKYKVIYMVYYLLLLAFFLYLPIINDNKGFYFAFVLVFLLYILSSQKNYKKIVARIKGYQKIVIAVAAMIIALFAAYNFFEPFKDIVNKSFRIISNGIGSTSAGQSSQRFSIINYFFQSDVNKLLGYGIGYCEWREKNGFGFTRFGLSDLGPFFLLGGITFVCLLCVFLFITLCRMNRSRLLSVGEILFFVFLLLYTQPATNCSIFASAMLIFLLLGINNHEKIK